MPIQMIASTSFMGVEGLIKRGQSFEVRDKARADYLERLHYADRSDQERAAYRTQTRQPQSQPSIAPNFTSIKGPDNQQTIEPENTNAENSEISAQEQPEASEEAIPPGDDLEGTSYKDLKAIAKDLQIKGYSSMKRDNLIAAIKKQDGGVNNGRN